jgi:hypothetical protein
VEVGEWSSPRTGDSRSPGRARIGATFRGRLGDHRTWAVRGVVSPDPGDVARTRPSTALPSSGGPPTAASIVKPLGKGIGGLTG